MSSKPSRFQQWVEGHWYGRPGLLSLLSPLEFLYKKTAESRQKAHAQNAQRYSVPVIVVGNISIGGTGKTPTIISLISFLQDKGFRVGIVSRGYGRGTTGLVIANKESSASDIGDEPYLIYSNTGCQLAVCENRSDAVQALNDDDVCDIILADDGLQHYSMFRDREIVVIDGLRGVGNGRMLPVGPLREPVQRMDTVDWALVNGAASSNPLFETATPVFNIHVEALEFVQVSTGKAFPLNYFSDTSREDQTAKIVAVAGLGNPQKFFLTLAELGLRFHKKAFKDHHAYTHDDFAHMDSQVILMTEKDAVKCKPIVGDNAFYLKVTMKLPDVFLEDFYTQINTLIKKD